MPDKPKSTPIVALNAEPTPQQRAVAFAQLRQALLPPAPVPSEALQLLYETALEDTGGSQAVRNFLFWLAGLPDPTGYTGKGGLELRRLDAERREAALEVLRWWSGPVKSGQPLYELLSRLCAAAPRGVRIMPVGTGASITGTISGE